MKTKILCFLLALLFVVALVACSGSNIEETGEHYLPEALFAEVKAAFEEKDFQLFPPLEYKKAPFSISDNAFAGKTLHSIILPVCETKKTDAEGMLQFTLYVMPNTYVALVSAKREGVTEYVIKLDPEEYGLEASKSQMCKYITVDLTEYEIKLSEAETLAFGAEEDSIRLAKLATSTAGKADEVLGKWKEEWLTTGYHAGLFSGSTGKEAGGLYYSRDSIPIDLVFDYGSAEAKAEVVAARERAAKEYADKLAAVAAAYGGKYLSLMGDSISSFAGITDNTDYSAALINNRCYYSKKYMNDHTQMYWGRFAEDTGMELCVINGWSSSKVYGGGRDKHDVVNAEKDNMLVRSTTLQNSAGQAPDVILLYMGINDVSYGHWSDLYDRLSAPGRKGTDAQIVGAWMEGVTATYEANKEQILPGVTYESWEASYALSLAQMREHYPNAEIYIINLTRSHHGSGTEEKITKANTCLAALAAYFDVGVIDQAKSEVNFDNCHLYGADEATPTALHPNLRGHAALTKLIVETLYENLPK